MITRLEARLLRIGALGLTLSGLAFAVSRYMLPHEDPFSAVGSPIETWALKAHVLLAPTFLFAVGLIYRRHVLGKLAEPGRAGRSSGRFLTGLITGLAATGYASEVVTDDGIRRTLSLGHLGAGTIFAIVWWRHGRLAAGRQSELNALDGVAARARSRTGGRA